MTLYYTSFSSSPNKEQHYEFIPQLFSNLKTLFIKQIYGQLYGGIHYTKPSNGTAQSECNIQLTNHRSICFSHFPNKSCWPHIHNGPYCPDCKLNKGCQKPHNNAHWSCFVLTYNQSSVAKE